MEDVARRHPKGQPLPISPQHNASTGLTSGSRKELKKDSCE